MQDSCVELGLMASLYKRERASYNEQAATNHIQDLSYVSTSWATKHWARAVRIFYACPVLCMFHHLNFRPLPASAIERNLTCISWPGSFQSTSKKSETCIMSIVAVRPLFESILLKWTQHTEYKGNQYDLHVQARWEFPIKLLYEHTAVRDFKVVRNCWSQNMLRKWSAFYSVFILAQVSQQLKIMFIISNTGDKIGANHTSKLHARVSEVGNILFIHSLARSC